MPTVTVIVPAYNHSRWVAETIASIAAQDGVDIELLVIDDGSPDDTAEVASTALESTDANHISWELIVKENEGLCATLNLGVEKATGEYISIIASDDAMAPGKLKQQVQYLESQPENVAGVYGDMQSMDEDSNLLGEISYAPKNPKGDAYLEFLMGERKISVQNGLFRTAAVRTLGGFDASLRFEDVDFLLRLLRRYEMHYLPGNTCLYRAVAGSLGRQTRYFIDDQFALLEKQLTPDNTRLRPLGKHAARRVRGRTWTRLGEAHVSSGDLRNARKMLANALKEWPFDVRTVTYLAASLTTPKLVPALARAKRTLRSRLRR